MALSFGESPLWISKFMGHRDTTMIIKVYSKYRNLFEEAEDHLQRDGSILAARQSVIIGQEK